MTKKKIIAIILFLFLSLFMFTFANPGDIEPELKKPEKTKEETKKEEVKEDTEEKEETTQTVVNQNTNNSANNNSSNETNKKHLEAPVIEVPEGSLVILLGESYDVMEGVKVISEENLTATADITDTSKLKEGKHTITYTVTDSEGNSATATREVVVLDPNKDEDKDGFSNGEEIIEGTDPLDEDSFEDAFKAKEWCTRPNQDDDDDNEIKEKEEKKIQKMKDNEEKKKEIFINMMNNKVKEVNEKWKKEFENLKTKFKNELEKRENLHQKNLEQIIGNMSNYFDSVIEAKVDNYNNEIKKVFATQIINNTTDFNKGNEDFKKNVNNLKDVQNSINEDIKNSYQNFADILKFSGVGNNK